ncbi:MAG: NADH-quinone oxidoreductase subunit H [Candidatus Omnitrophica bacterium]|nr:NADH-quinone oxidoreductase subunit H [Candidatus Omnitrophota bacterium]
MAKIVSSILQVVALAAISPLVSGVITKIKNNLRLRRGPGVLQPYYNLAKLFKKEEVISETASWIFSAAPFVVFAASITAAFMVPAFISGYKAGDLLLLVFLFSLARFFQALAGLDAGSSFGAMGSSREMFVSSFAEPAAILAIFAVSLNLGTTNIGAINSLYAIKLSTVIAAISLFMVILAETSRIPIDNQETHLELTMIHEAMVLEYSGRSLALIELASYIKQIVFFSLIGTILLPAFLSCNFANNLTVFAGYLAKLLVLCVVVSLIEVNLAKMRLFRAIDFFSFSFVLALIAIIMAALGV